MVTQIKGEYLADAYKANIISGNGVDWELTRTYDNKKDYPEKYEKNHGYNLAQLSEESLIKFQKFLENKKDAKIAVNAIIKWLALIKDPINSPCNSIATLESLFRKLIEKQKTNIFFLQQEDDTFYPVLFSDIRTDKDDEEGKFLRITFKYSRLKTNSTSRYDDDYEEDNSMQTKSIDLTFFKNDLSSDGADVFDDKKSEWLKLTDILAKQFIFPYDEEYMQIYKIQLENFFEKKKHVGKQFIAKGKCLVQSGWWFWSSSKFAHIDSLVIIEEISSKVDNRLINTEKNIGTKKESVPIHPYLKCYDLINHRYILLNPSSLIDYEYNDKLIDKLVLDDNIKNILKLIVNSENDYSDLIPGKSKGRIVLSTGEPGLGKTLIAEIYAESLRKPLYKIQASQLGTDPEEIEKRLKKILVNAYRWDCILLIDEADTYIRARKDDIYQNCIIGVFLRLLEYYEGILFLTSNRGDEIDDAVLSRCTLHIRYKYPTLDQAKQIFNILAENNEVKVAPKEMEAILKTFAKDKVSDPIISGRDIGTIIKNLKKLSKIKNEPISLKLFNDIKDFLYLHKK